MTTKTFLSLTLIAILAFVGCNKATPAGFWKDFKNDMLVKNISDQEPCGGHRGILWKANKPNTFTSSGVPWTC